ncbi:MAG: hypothetical protein EX285_02615 [Thaumarchaeota archaeon]|nr:hypothetical protein [Nitrososphaerota archaeon]
MVGHRKKKVEVKKKITKWHLILPIIFGAGGTGIAFGINWFISGPPPLTQCIPGENLSFDQDSFLYVTLDGEPFTVPSDIGIIEGCVKPIHFHENDIVEDDGINWVRIHSVYFKPTRFSLHDFFDLWGLDLSKYDIKILTKEYNKNAPGRGSFTEIEFNKIEDIRTLVLSNNIKIKVELTNK